MNYKITKADLIGEIAYFPIEVVEKMIERQVEQGNKADVSVFQLNVAAGVSQGGFTWLNTREKADFWCEIIHRKQFDVFFAKYPKNDRFVYIFQDGTKCGHDLIETLIKRGGINNKSYSGTAIGDLYYIEPISNLIKWVRHTDEDTSKLLKTFYTEIDVEPSIKEYTMQEIADKLGIKVENLRIKK